MSNQILLFRAIVMSILSTMGALLIPQTAFSCDANKNLIENGDIYSRNLPYAFGTNAIGISPVISEVSQPGKADGSISLVVTNGTPPYQYSWSHDASLQSSVAMNLATGNYTVSVTDANGCQVIETFTVLEPLACDGSFFQLAKNSQTNSMDVYLISITSSGFSPTFLFPTAYNAQALDAFGFNQSDGYIYALGKGNQHLIKIGAGGFGKDLGALAGIDPNLNYTSAVCNGDDYYLYGNGNPGALYRVDVSNLTLTTLNGAISMGKDIAYLTDGAKEFIVSVRNGRLGRYNINTPSFSAILPVQAIGVNPLNNDNEFTSLWADDDSTLFVYNSASGQGHRILNIGGDFYSFDLGSFGYTIPLTDGFNCLDGGPAIPCQIKVSVQSLVCDNGSGTGSIDLKASSGNSALQYRWSNGETTRDISSLVSGSYSVTIFDHFGCHTTLDIDVPICSSSKTGHLAQTFNHSPFQITPNPAGSWANLGIYSPQAEQVDIHITNLSGQQIFSRKEQLFSGQNAIYLSLEDLQPGVYFVHAKFISGEEKTSRLLILRH